MQVHSIPLRKLLHTQTNTRPLLHRYSSLRPAARRLLLSSSSSSSVSFLAKRSRSIAATVSTPTALRLTRRSHSPRFAALQEQRRWNSDDAAIKKESTPEKETEKTEKEETQTTSAAEQSDSDARVVEESAVQAATEQSSSATENEVAEGTETSAKEASPAAANEAAESAETAAAQGEAASEQSGDTQENGTQKRRLWEPPTPKETIYVGNLFFDVTAEDLKRQMSKYGTVEHAKIVHDSRGLSKGFGYVVFDSVDAATRAVDGMNMQVFEGRRVVVQFAQTNFKRGRITPAPTRTLFIGNLGWDLTDRDLNDLFRDIRNVIDVRVAIDRKTGQPRGFAHAEFIDVPSAQVAFEILSTKTPRGRKLFVDYSTTNNKNRARNPRDQFPEDGEQMPPEERT
ncbi:hypothetical protein VTN77DRAFT_5148 [Rasamsonia byssochlamydoides]|uniref:uncharacterized protein n=1 Tax=Rasamsonia byssochlamydoides TaxID=89139 RepID=UPI003742B6DE